MLEVSGRLGRVYVGHRRVMELKNWSVTRKVETIGGITGMDIRGSASVVSIDAVHGRSWPTCIALRCGTRWWIWTIFAMFDVEGEAVNFALQGHPVIEEQGRSYYAT